MHAGGEASIWFCDAYASWQKGGVENTDNDAKAYVRQQNKRGDTRHPMRRLSSETS